jgi:diketogulonate reductase-like aldo/keto reductase
MRKRLIALMAAAVLAGCSSEPALSSASIEETAEPVSEVQEEETEPTVTLNSGYEMPVLGLGTWTLSNEEAEESVYHALKDGFRLIDTAEYYGDEEGVGKGVRRAVEEGIVTREEVFVTTKVMPSAYGRALEAIRTSNETLELGYIDLVLIHQPGSNDEAVYKGMEEAVKEGIVRSIGISNYYTKEELDTVLSYAEITPAVIQNENHLFYNNRELQEYAGQYGIVMEGWYPFGGRGHTQDSFQHPTVQKIVSAHGKTSAQIILRWHYQNHVIAIPGSSNPDHIQENFDIWDFSLSEEEMSELNAINTQTRYENW